MKKPQEILFKNGDKYLGLLNSQNEFHGEGLYTFQDGSFYKGQFSSNLFSGKGLFSCESSGIKYEGTFSEGFLEGKSHVFYKNNVEYQGFLLKNQRSGFGTLKFVDFNGFSVKYEGDFFEDLFEGKGKLYIDEKLCFEGDFSKGKYHGKGKEFNEDFSYEGEFFSGEKQGKGKNLYRNGDSYEGFFKENQKNGFGIYFYKDGSSYKGDFSMNLRAGKGKLQCENGDFYEGEWKNDLYEGKGVLKTKDLEIKGVFVKGLLEGKAEITKKNKEFTEVLKGNYEKNEKNGRVSVEILKGDKKKRGL